MIRSIAFALSLVVVFSAAPVPAADMVSRFVGVWAGEGSVRLNGFGAREKVRCRIVGRLKTPSQINLEGKCATTSGAAKIRLFVAQNSGGNIFSAEARLSTKVETMRMSGIRDGDAVRLNSQKPQEKDGRMLTSSLRLSTVGKAGFDMVNTLTDQTTGDEAVSLAIKLTRKR